MNDGAGALVVASDEWAKQNGKQVLATIVAQAQVADDFPYLARTPANATKLALEKAGLSVDDIDLFEINEAFASVALNSVRMLEISEDKVNVNGGAIALGHPIGASGARILMTLVHELRRRGGGLGVAAICSGGGQGDAVIVEVNGSLVPELERPDGARIHYEVRGEGPLVVLSLGFAATPATYEGLVADLARDHRVLTWEPRGCGNSSADGPFDIPTDADDLLALIHAVGPPAIAYARRARRRT